MKMKLSLLRDYNGLSSLERFSFDKISGKRSNGDIDDVFALVKMFSSVDFDPLIPEQDINVDLGSSYGQINYACFEVITDAYEGLPRQYLDKMPEAWYFYVTDIKRKPSSTVCTLHLKLDGLTTLFDPLDGTEESINVFTEQSFIRREHRSRFLIPTTAYTNLQYNIDKEPEGIAVPLKKSYFRTLYNNSAEKPSAKWYLIYKTAKNWDDTSSGNAISLYLACSDSLKISNSTSSGTGSNVVWSSAGDVQFVVGNWYYISSDWSAGFDFDLFAGDETYTPSDYGALVAVRIISVSGNDIRFEAYGYKGSPGAITSSVHVTMHVYANYATFRRATFFYVLDHLSTDLDEIKTGTKLQINAGTTTVSAVYSTKFDDVDRTDPLIVKIIESPYCPDQLICDNNVISPTYLCYSITGWTFDQATKLWVPSSSASFSQTLRDNIDGTAYFKTHKPTYEDVSRAAIDDVWSGFDPKLFHSDFHISKVVYDVYAVEIKLEDMSLNTNTLYTSTTARDMIAKWYISPDINSVFLLEVTPKNAISYPSKTQDFGQFAVIDRNNEKPIFSNAYLNYMRVGYNFDQKAKSLQNWSAIAGIAISAAGTVVGAATGQAYITAAGVAGLIGSITSAAMGAAQRENSFDANLAKLKAQATSVSGSSDVAILDKYNPRCAYIEYDPVDSVKESLARLFHMFGYKTNRFKSPDILSRSVWNYLEGDVVLSVDAVSGYPQTILKRAVEQVAQGITILHYTDGYNLDTLQVSENWETDLL